MPAIVKSSSCHVCTSMLLRNNYTESMPLVKAVFFKSTPPTWCLSARDKCERQRWVSLSECSAKRVIWMRVSRLSYSRTWQTADILFRKVKRRRAGASAVSGGGCGSHMLRLQRRGGMKNGQQQQKKAKVSWWTCSKIYFMLWQASGPESHF